MVSKKKLLHMKQLLLGPTELKTNNVFIVHLLYSSISFREFIKNEILGDQVLVYMDMLYR